MPGADGLLEWARCKKRVALVPLMWRRIGRFRALPPEEKRLLVRAWFLLGWFRAAINRVPLRQLTADLELHAVAPLPTPLSGDQQSQAAIIGRLVSAAARYTPWQSRCLVQVLVVQNLLARSGIPGQFHLGVRRGCGPTGDSTGLLAHAWLQCGGRIVNGAAGHELFTVVSTFRWGRVA